jgi:linoleate 8R-lipoxygenase/9,12-octadecadienoate 8-hydroperoxide 8R-isomerase
LVYRWHSCVSEDDEKWTDRLLEQVRTKSQLPKDADATQIIRAAAKWADDLIKTAPQNRPFENLQRRKDGKFSDNDLAEIWFHAVDDVAGAFGAQHVPSNLKFVEVLSV